jgi:glycosyltransferase involved in cell wall biosynthesis
MEIALLSIGYPPYYSFGGSETYVKLLSEELARNGINVTVIAGWPGKETSVENRGDRLKVIRLPVINQPIRTVWYQLLNKDAIMKLLKRADVVHCNNLVASLINKKIMNSKSLIISVHGSLGALSTYSYALRKHCLSIGDFLYFMEYPLIKSFYLKDLLYSNALIFISNHGYHEALKYLGDKSSLIPSKSTTIYPGINLKEISVYEPKSYDGGDVEIAYVGRLFWPKGITYAIEAFNIIVNEMGEENAKFHVMGDGPLRGWIIRYVKKHRLAKNIKIYGQVSRDFVMRTLGNTSAIILPSLYEGCPYILMEANALGLPMVTFDLAWSREFITNGLNGFRSPPFDVHKLAERTRAVLKATSLRPSLIKEEAKKFDIRTTAKKTLEIYNNLL